LPAFVKVEVKTSLVLLVQLIMRAEGWGKKKKHLYVLTRSLCTVKSCLCVEDIQGGNPWDSVM